MISRREIHRKQADGWATPDVEPVFDAMNRKQRPA